jgi:hypothetical protein
MPHIHFHFGNDLEEDYNVRIVNDGNGTLTIDASDGTFVPGPLVAGESILYPAWEKLRVEGAVSLNLGTGTDPQNPAAVLTSEASGYGLIIKARGGTHFDLYVDPGGSIGIGTASPSSKLEVNGNVTVSGNIAAKYQDIAEWVSARERIPAAGLRQIAARRRGCDGGDGRCLHAADRTRTGGGGFAAGSDDGV